jgi:hypothetical protein
MNDNVNKKLQEMATSITQLASSPTRRSHKQQKNNLHADPHHEQLY